MKATLAIYQTMLQYPSACLLHLYTITILILKPTYISSRWRLVIDCLIGWRFRPPGRIWVCFHTHVILNEVRTLMHLENEAIDILIGVFLKSKTVRSMELLINNFLISVYFN